MQSVDRYIPLKYSPRPGPIPAPPPVILTRQALDEFNAFMRLATWDHALHPGCMCRPIETCCDWITGCRVLEHRELGA